MIGNEYWATGVILSCLRDGEWRAKVEFFDAGFCDNKSTEGELKTRYLIDVELAIDTVIEDAEKLGIVFQEKNIYMIGDGEWKDEYYPDNWRQIIGKQCDRIGWNNIYQEKSI